MSIKSVYILALSLLGSFAAEAQTQDITADPNYVRELPVPDGFRNHSGMRMQLSDRLLTVSPMQFTENGVGLSVSYEKGIDKDGIITYNLPVMATFNLSNTYEQVHNQDAMFYVMPGLKFYPTSYFGKVKYAVGPALVLGAGQQTIYTNEFPYYSPQYNTYSKFILGIVVNNSLNINPTPRFYMGLDFGFGFSYINRVDNVNKGMMGLVNGGFKIGYRL